MQSGAEKPKIDTSKRNTEGTAMMSADLLMRRRGIFMKSPKKDL
jgi:hypothetical protein